MPAPSYSSSGAGAADNGTSGTISPAAPATVAAGDLLIWHGFVMSDPNGGSLSTPAGFTPFAGNPYGTRTTNTYTPRVYLFWKRAAGTEGGAAQGSNYTLAGAVNSRGVYARVHRFTAVNGFATAPVEAVAITEGVTATGTTTLACPTVTPGGVNRLGVICSAVNDNAGTVGDATGESGGDWTEAVAEFVSGTGGDGTIGLQTAALAGGSQISGGAIPYGSTGDEWVNVGFALVESGDVVLAVAGGGAAIASGTAPTRITSLATLTGLTSATGNSPEVTQSTPFVNTVEVGAVAWLFAPNLALTPGEGAVGALGAEPTHALQLGVEGGSGTAAGNTPAIQADILPASGDGLATGTTPPLTITLASTLGQISCAGATPEVTSSMPEGTNTVEVGAVVWLFRESPALFPENGLAVAEGAAPAVAMGVGCQAGLSLAAGAQAEISLTLSPSRGDAFAAGATPGTQLDHLPATGLITAAGSSPSISLLTPQSVTPQSGIASLAGNVPAAQLALAPDAGAGQAIGSSPTKTAGTGPSVGTVAAAGNIPTYLTTIETSAGLISASGQPPAISLAIPDGVNTVEIGAVVWLFYETVPFAPERGAVVVQGNTPAAESILSPPPGTLAAIGNNPALSQTKQAAAGAITAGGDTPGIFRGGDVIPQLGMISAHGNVPDPITIYFVAGPDLTGVVAAVGREPSLFSSVVLSPDAGLVGVGGEGPGVARGLLGEQGLVTAGGDSPTIGVSSATDLTPTTGVVLASSEEFKLSLLLAPTEGLVAGGGQPPATAFTYAPAPASVSAAGNTPVLTIQQESSPITGIVAAQGASPALLNEIPGVSGAAIASGATPTLPFGFAFEPERGAVFAEGAIAGIQRELLVSAGAALASGTSPVLTLQTGTMPITGVAAASGTPPNLSQALAPSAGLASAQGNAPTRTQTLQAVSGEASATGNPPFVLLQAENSPIPGLASASGNAPLLSQVLAPSRGIAAASGTPPHVSTGLDLTPQTSTVQASGNLPLRQLSFGPAPSTVLAAGSAPTLAQILVPAPDGIILASGQAPTLAQAFVPATGTALAAGDIPERFVGRFVFPETGSANASAAETSTLTLILELISTTTLRAVGNAVEVQLALPGNRRETALTRLFSRLLLLTPSGILVVRNSTIPLAVPPAGAVVMLDSGPDTTDRGTSEDFYEHRVRLELFIMKTNPLAKTIQDLEDEVAAILAGDRTLGGVIDQMFLFPTSSLALTGGGTPIDINALSVSLTYGEPHAAL